MNTTEIHIEHFMSGVLSVIFIVIMAAACLPINPRALEVVLSHETLAAIIAVSVTYPLGIFSDNLADKLLGSYEASLKEKANCQGRSIRGLIVEMNVDFIRDYFNYNRVRIRIARSTWLNFLGIGLAILVFDLVKMEFLKSHDLVMESYFCLVLAFVVAGYALLNWRWITLGNFKTLRKWSDAYMSRKGSDGVSV